MKACRKCHYIVINAKECPICHGKDLTEHFSGMSIIIDSEKSDIGKVLGITKPGIYALKIKK